MAAWRAVLRLLAVVAASAPIANVPPVLDVEVAVVPEAAVSVSVVEVPSCIFSVTVTLSPTTGGLFTVKLIVPGVVGRSNAGSRP